MRTAALGTLLLLGGIAAKAPDAKVLRVATSGAEKSPAGQVFKIWAQAVKHKSGEMIELSITYGQDDLGMVDGLSGKTLDAALVTGRGLRKISPDLGALEMPGAFASAATLEKTRDAVTPVFQKTLKEHGLTFIQWAGEKARRLASKGVPLSLPDSLKNRKFLASPGDVFSSLLARELGATVVESDRSAVADKLSAGELEVVLATAASIQELEWNKKLDLILEDVVSYEVDSIVFSSASLDALSEDLKSIVLDTGRIAGTALAKRTRAEDSASYKRLTERLQVSSSTDEDKSKWRKVWEKVQKRATDEKCLSPEMLSALEASQK